MGDGGSGADARALRTNFRVTSHNGMVRRAGGGGDY